MMVIFEPRKHTPCISHAFLCECLNTGLSSPKVPCRLVHLAIKKVCLRSGFANRLNTTETARDRDKLKSSDIASSKCT